MALPDSTQRSAWHRAYRRFIDTVMTPITDSFDVVNDYVSDSEFPEFGVTTTVECHAAAHAAHIYWLRMCDWRLL